MKIKILLIFGRLIEIIGQSKKVILKMLLTILKNQYNHKKI